MMKRVLIICLASSFTSTTVAPAQENQLNLHRTYKCGTYSGGSAVSGDLGVDVKVSADDAKRIAGSAGGRASIGIIKFLTVDLVSYCEKTNNVPRSVYTLPARDGRLLISLFINEYDSVSAGTPSLVGHITFTSRGEEAELRRNDLSKHLAELENRGRHSSVVTAPVIAPPDDRSIRLGLPKTNCVFSVYDKTRRITAFYPHPTTDEEAAKFDDSDATRQFTLQAARDVAAHCAKRPLEDWERRAPPAPPTHAIVVVLGAKLEGPFGGEDVDSRYQATVDLSGGWRIENVDNGVALRRRKLAEAKQQQEAKRKEEEQWLRNKANALADCGASPKITGGPWFSRTYTTAALDEARHLSVDLVGKPVWEVMVDALGKYFLCVKEIQYVGPAVNPMGGNAARALFIGYAKAGKFDPVRYTHDFPY